MNPQSDIITYITAQLHAGISSQEVADQLRGAGWSEEQITSVFDDYRARTTIVTPVADVESSAPTEDTTSAPATLPTPIKRGRLKIGWLLFKQSLSVIKSNPGLVRYMIIMMLWSIGIFAALVILLFVDGGSSQLLSAPYTDIDGSSGYTVTLLGIAVAVLFGFLGTFTTFFYGAALSSHVLAIFRGTTTDYTVHIARAKKRIVAIAVYAAIATTVGYLLRLLEERLQLIGWIVARLLGALWTLATSFVLPIIADSEETGAQSIKHSVGLFKKTWGETIVSRVSLTGLIGLIYILVGIPVTVVAAIVLGGIFGATGVIVVCILFILGVIVLSVLGSLASSILNTSLYYYAQYGSIPPAFSPELLASVFIEKKKKKQK